MSDNEQNEIELVEDKAPGESLVRLAEFIEERKEAIRAGAYEIEIANLNDGALMQLVSFGVSVRQGLRFKLNIDFKES